MTIKHTRQNYFYKQIRLAAKAIRGIFEVIRTDRKQAKEKARSRLDPTTHEPTIVDKDTSLIQEYAPSKKRKKKASKRK